MFNQHSKRRTQIRQEIWIIVLILAPIFGQANPFLELSGGIPSDGLSARYSQNQSSVYFNPAYIDLSRQSYSLSFTSWHRSHTIQRFERPVGYDIPESVFEARIDNEGQLSSLDFRPLPTSSLIFEPRMSDQSNHQFMIFAFSKPIIEDELAIGIITLLPLGSFQEQRPYFVDENAQFFDNRLHFEQLSHKFGSMIVTGAVNWRAHKYIKLGAGLTLASNSNASPEVFVSDAANNDKALTLSQVTVNSSLVPHIGLAVDINQNWSLNSAVHFPYQSTVSGKSNLRFWEQENKETTKPPVAFDFVFDYLPLRVSLGQMLQWRSNQIHYTVSGGALWQRWSSYIDRVGSSEHSMKDTISPEIKLLISMDRHQAQLSGRYSPSSVPEQDGRKNYVDNDQLLLSAGYSLRTKLDSQTLKIGIGCNAYHLIERDNWKKTDANNPIVDELPNSVSIKTGKLIPESEGLQTNNPGFPGFSSHGFGFIWSVTIGVEI